MTLSLIKSGLTAKQYKRRERATMKKSSIVAKTYFINDKVWVIKAVMP
jgi:hypothetical protein